MHPKNYRLWLTLLLSAFLLAGCMSPAEEFIQGGWRFESDHLAPIVAEQHLIIVWYFDSGTFSYDACCFNTDEHITGRYRVLEQTEDTLMIEFFNSQGSNRKMQGQYLLTIDREADTLSISGAGIYDRFP